MSTSILPAGMTGFDLFDEDEISPPVKRTVLEEMHAILSGLKRDDVVQIGRHKWRVFQSSGSVVYAYKQGTKARKFYRVTIDGDPVRFVVYEALGGGARDGAKVADGVLIPEIKP